MPSLKNIIVTPSKAQLRYRKEVRPYMDKNAAINLAKDLDSVNESRIDRDYRINNFVDIYNMADKPRIRGGQNWLLNLYYPNTDTPRPNYTNFPRNTMYNIKNMDNAIAELSHPIQYKMKKKNKIKQSLQQMLYDISGKYEDLYKISGSSENETHKVVEPVLRNYVNNGLHYANGTLLTDLSSIKNYIDKELNKKR